MSPAEFLSRLRAVENELVDYLTGSDCEVFEDIPEIDNARSELLAIIDAIELPDHSVFMKVYDGESLVDLERDISEAFDPEMATAPLLPIPKDQHGFMEGEFIVSIAWRKSS